MFELYIILLAIVLIVIIVFFTQFLWNNIMPDVFGVKEIGFWQTLGLMILLNILFGGGANKCISGPNYY